MITKTKEKGQSIYTREHVFSGWDEYVDECERRSDLVLENNHGAKVAAPHREGDHEKQFSGVKNWGEAVQLARCGWPDGLSLMMKMKQDLGVVFGSMVKRARMKNDWTGGTVSVQRWLNNKPKIFRRRVTQFEVGTGRVLDIHVDVSASAWNSKEKLMRRGASILLLIDSLESSGISCQVMVQERVTDCTFDDVPKEISYCVRVPIKKAGEQLDMDLLAFAVVHPATLRRLFFAMLAGEDDDFGVKGGFYRETREGGYGSPIRYGEEEYREEEDVPIPDCNESKPWDDLHECADWVRDKLKDCGVKLDEETT